MKFITFTPARHNPSNQVKFTLDISEIACFHISDNNIRVVRVGEPNSVCQVHESLEDIKAQIKAYGGEPVKFITVVPSKGNPDGQDKVLFFVDNIGGMRNDASEDDFNHASIMGKYECDSGLPVAHSVEEVLEMIRNAEEI